MRAVSDLELELELELLRARRMGKWEKYLEVRSCRHRKLMIACQMCMFINIFLSCSVALSLSVSLSSQASLRARELSMACLSIGMILHLISRFVDCLKLVSMQ